MTLPSAIVAVLLAASAPASEPAPLRACPPGQLVDAPDGKSPAEIVTFHPALVMTLVKAAPATSLRIDDWPVAPSVRQTVAVTRHEVYAPDARLVAIEAGLETEVPRSRLLFFWGIAEGDPRTRVLLFVDPDAGTLGGLSVSPDGMHEIVPAPEGRGRYLIAPWDSRLPARDGRAGWSCGGGERIAGPAPLTATPAAGTEPAAISSLHTLVAAVDTDNELLSLKFTDNVTNAVNYVATLFGSLNVIYERDLFVRLLQGYTIFRVSSAPDPYAQGGSGASSAQLNEFRSYWSANYGGVKRGLAMMLSGKASSPNSSSGIAFLSVLCSMSSGYSFTQVFKFAGATGASDAFVVGHELGHNVGSDHTHCFPTVAAPVDRCYNQESGCYTGPTSCPTPFTIDPVNGGPVSNVRGTIMSYCNFLGGCSVSTIFHPESVNVIAPLVQSGVGVCVFPQGAAAPTVTAISPGTGPTGGGSPFTLTGSNFRSGATVAFADRSSATAATGITVVSGSQITGTLAPRPAGLTDVIVANSDQLTGRLRDAFTFVPTPSAALDYFTISPCRLVDTRTTHPPALAAQSTRTFVATGSCGVPSTAKAVSVNLTAVGPASPGFVTLFPGNGLAPSASSLNFSSGQTRGNNAIVLLATDGAGTIGVRNGSAGTVHFVLDVNGYFR